MPGNDPVSRQTFVRPVAAWLAEHPLLVEVGLPALTLMFGLQVLRVLVPGLTWTLGDRFGLGSAYLGLVALAAFLAAFLAGGLGRLLGGTRAVVLTAGGLGLLRLLMQVWWGEPLVNLVLAIVGTALFVLFLPLFLDTARRRGGPAVGHLALGLLLGLALDTAVHSAFLTYDPVWQPTWPALLVTVVRVVLQWVLLAGAAVPSGPEAAGAGGSGSRFAGWLAIGPFLFLHLVVLQNVARLTAVTGWRLPVAAGWVLIGQLAAMVAAVWLLGRRRRTRLTAALTGGTALVAVSFFPYPEPGWVSAVTLIVGQVSSALLLVLVVVGGGSGSGRPGFRPLVLGNGVGMVLLMVLLLAYYVVYQVSLPYGNTVLEIGAAVLVVGCALVPVLSPGEIAGRSRRVWLLPALAVVLLVPSLVSAAVWQEPAAVPGKGYPVRVMTYNLHNGFSPTGYLGLEALAGVIEEAGPDIVALQEVSRGWVISGRVDMLTWLSQRLDMPYVSGPTADALWGNAILSRYPIVEYQTHELPPRDLFILRGFTVAVIDLGDGGHLRFVATHFHHLEEDPEVRRVQAGSLVGSLGDIRSTIVLGDFNADPAAPEMEAVRTAGLVDAAGHGNPSPANTFSSVRPHQRIDHIWVSPDLQATEVYVPVTLASDHLPVIAVIDR